MPSSDPLSVVIAGGGIAALEAVMALHDLAGERVRPIIVAPEAEFELKPLRTAEPFSAGHVPSYPMSEIAERFGAELRQGALASVDAEAHAITLADGSQLDYDALIVATGARSRPAYERVITFGADARTDILSGLLADLEEHYTRSVAFVVPPGVSWPLPLYEIALMAAAEVRSMGIDDARMQIITPESTPLAIFGTEASEAVAKLLGEAGVEFRGDAYAAIERGGHITIRPGDETVQVDRIVALPILEGLGIDGLPSDEHGFVPIDDRGRVRGLTDVYAAGDGADFPVKQGGLACQQADAIAQYLAAQAGAPVEPRPFRPVLRGKLLTGRGSEFLRTALHGGAGPSEASDFALWYPPTKVSGHYLSQWLTHIDATARDEASLPFDEPAVDIEVPLPSPYELSRQAMRLDPLSPQHH